MSSSRSTTVLILVLALVAGLGAAAWWFLSVDAVPRPGRAELGIAESVTPGATQSPVALAEEPAPAPEPASARAEATDMSVGELVPEASELSDAIWVEGRVVVPVGTPADERVELYASGRSFKKSKGHRVRIDDEGRFRIAFAKGTKNGTLKLEARYLFLREPLTLKLAEMAGPLELAPELGGVIRGRIEIDGAAPELRARIAGTTVSASSENSGGGAFQRHAKVAADLGFELLAVPVDGAPKLSFDPAFLVPIRDVAVPVEAAKIVEQNLRADPGATLRARFVDPEGRPLAKVNAVLMPDWSKPGDGARQWVHRQQTSDADGRITMEGLPKSALTLSAQLRGYKPLSRPLEPAKDELGALELTLDRGFGLEGVVRWPDGTPAAEARVSWSSAEEGFNFASPFGSSIEADSDGRFTISGLEEAAYTLRAEASRKVPDPDAPAGAKKLAKTKRETLRGRLKEIRPGAGALEIQLSNGLLISGVAIDDLGSPLETFSVKARKQVDNGWTMEGVARHFKGGAFELDGVHEGRWEISATSPKHANSAPFELTLPGPSEGLRLVLPRQTVLSGSVQNADGTPAAKAAVRWKPAAEQEPSFVAFDMNGDGVTRCKSDGTFRVDGLAPGKGTLRAQSNDGAESLPLELTLGPGQAIGDLVLHLEGLGEVRGTLHGSIAERERRRVSLEEDDERDWRLGDTSRETLTDARGDFVFLRVPAGKWKALLEPVAETKDSDEELGPTWDWSERQALRLPHKFELQAGQITNIVLGTPPSGKLRISGRVMAGGRPREGARVTARWSNDHEKARTTRTDGTGRYELALEEPGTYVVNCRGKSGTTQTRQLELGETGEQMIDFELGGGTLSGTIVGPEGTPTGQCSLNLRNYEATGNSTHGNAMVGDDGAFSFGDLGAGKYTIDVNRWNDGERPLADQTFGPFELAENQQLEGLELRLQLAGNLVLSVTGQGATDKWARVLMWDETRAAQESEHVRVGATDSKKVRPGAYDVCARSGEVCSRWDSAVVVAGKRAELALALDCSGRVEVTVVDSAGTAVPCRLQVFGRHDIDFAAFGGSSGEGTRQVGPLPPGEYTVVASNNDGELGRQAVEVGTSGTREVRIERK
jgi:Carboxypeptidase regulatory-like domain